MTARLTLIALLAALALAAPAAAYDPQTEAANFARINQRFSSEQADADFQGQVAQHEAIDMADILQRDATAGGDRFSGSLCGSGTLACAGDPRMYDFAGKRGQITPVIYKNRNGAHIEGHIWLSNASVHGAGPASLPGVVIETGSVQAPERWYMWIAEVLANHGYEVMTFDVQGQGRSDAFGSHDQQHFAKGFPAQDTTHFVEDLEDAIGFFEGDANPGAALLDRSRLGIAGHSLGATSVSIVQAQDPRVDVAVAWDNVDASVTPRVPMLGMSADYWLDPTPYTSDPDPDSKATGFAKWKQAGVDAMQVVLRGGTHYEWSYAPMMLPASLRGIDSAAWYTTAWLDKYLEADPTADARLLSNRWRADPRDAALDPAGKGNLFSFYYRSPVAITLADGTPFACSDLRSSCPLRTDDGEPYSYLDDRG